MLLHSYASSVEISEGFDSSSFTIVDSDNSFALLQGKQYENPVNATLRALVENGMDAHTDAGQNDKVKIVFKDRSVCVQDSGLGISPDVFENHFTKFFASNRTHSNDYHGFFGVGAKAPLAVAKEFRVHTVHKGMAYTWVCRRGNPAPTAQLLESGIAATNDVGTTIILNSSDMDERFNNIWDWMSTANELCSTMPDTVSTHGNSRHPNNHAVSPQGRLMISGTADPCHLMIGGMAYPLPDKELLGLPEDFYKPLNVSYPVDSPAATATRGKAFGVRSIRQRHETKNIVFGIGEVELHFSKERVASTPANIERIRTRALQTWLDWQLELAREFSVLPNASAVKWRMPGTAAQELKKQGHSTALLAWASRPSMLEGPMNILEESPADVGVVSRSAHKPALSTAKRWVATVNSPSEHQAIEQWAHEWGLGMHWEQTTTKNNATVVSVDQLKKSQVVEYDKTIEKVDTRGIGKDTVVIGTDTCWNTLDGTTQEAISNWLHANNVHYVVMTSLSVADAKKEIPHAMDAKTYCRTKLLAMLDTIPEDILGMKTGLVSGKRWASIDSVPWVTRRWPGPCLPFSMTANETMTMYTSLHGWLDVAPIDYMDLDAWETEQRVKLPLLNYLNAKLPQAQLLHLNELLNHP